MYVLTASRGGPVPFPSSLARWGPLRPKNAIFPLFLRVSAVDLPSRNVDLAVAERPRLWAWGALS